MLAMTKIKTTTKTRSKSPTTGTKGKVGSILIANMIFDNNGQNEFVNHGQNYFEYHGQNDFE